ncbi:hypothetical protein OIU84_022330 [Salix udensis]|uniref:General transcription and DNA repair factor IIH subunit TFB5 n=1 Tax=Salix udensis TaxID=889485 RepID=A0AAD6PEM5_9ROSI|nr:hypothetical protein OIU84_022330 [Salix udensis]KAJ6426716.1 hypothetical protein OIU84_022330 [Salix udensis]
MVNATKGLLISCDIPMAQFIINLNASLPGITEVHHSYFGQHSHVCSIPCL